MSAAARTDSPAGYPASHAATRAHSFIETSSEINEFMKMQVINLVEHGLRQVGKRLYGAKIAIMGFAYKKNSNDPGESPAIKIIEELVNLGADVRVYDSFVPSIRTKAGVFASVGSVEEALRGVECAVFMVDHDVFRRISTGMVKRLIALAGGCEWEESLLWLRGDCVSGDWERAWSIDPFFTPVVRHLNRTAASCRIVCIRLKESASIA